MAQSRWALFIGVKPSRHEHRGHPIGANDVFRAHPVVGSLDERLALIATQRGTELPASGCGVEPSLGLLETSDSFAEDLDCIGASAADVAMRIVDRGGRKRGGNGGGPRFGD